MEFRSALKFGLPRQTCVLWSLSLFVVVLCSQGCGADAAPGAADAALDASRDAKDVEVADVELTDVALPSDASDAADISEPEVACTYARVELRDGREFVAELIATYDHRLWWWDVSNTSTVAFFRADQYDYFPDDHSFRFVTMGDIVRTQAIPRPEGSACYQTFLRSIGHTIARPPLDGISRVLMGNSGYHLYEGGTGDFAWDFTRIDASGARYVGDGSRNQDYLVWDEPVYAPVSGYIIEVVRDAPDNAPGGYPGDAINNMVGIHLGGNFYVYVLHFRQGSIDASIKVGDIIEAGERLGRAGNSGVTLEPHVHVVLLWHDADADSPRSWSVPAEFRDLETAPLFQGPFELHDYVRPQTGDMMRKAAP